MNRDVVVRHLLLISALVGWLAPSCGAAPDLRSATPADAAGASLMASPTPANLLASTPWAAGTEAAAATSAALATAAASTPTPWVAGTEAALQTAEAGRLITVVGNSVSFDCPAAWNPTRNSPADDLYDSWTLAISQGELASIGFAGAGLERFIPPRVLIMVDGIVTIGGKPGFKWIRRTQIGGSDIVYEYMTTGLNDEGIFGFSVLLPEMDASVELQLDRLAETVAFLETP